VLLQWKCRYYWKYGWKWEFLQFPAATFCRHSMVGSNFPKSLDFHWSEEKIPYSKRISWIVDILLAFLLVLGRKTWRHQRGYSVPWNSWKIANLELNNISSKCNMFSPWNSWTIANLELNNISSKCKMFSPWNSWKIANLELII
jgi:hypothetical protein